VKEATNKYKKRNVNLLEGVRFDWRENYVLRGSICWILYIQEFPCAFTYGWQ